MDEDSGNKRKLMLKRPRPYYGAYICQKLLEV
jgi:hypothetical protein